MKGILVFNKMNDLVFKKMDNDLYSHFYKLGLKEHLIEENSEKENDNIYISKDVIVQIFSPLMASYKVMLGQFAQKYKSIEIEDGTIIVFRKYLNYVIVNINSAMEGLDATEKETTVFLTFAKMLCGPYLYLLTKNTLENELNRRDMMLQLVDEWHLLRNESQMFLVEAVERLLLNKSIAALAVNLLQEVLLKARSCLGEGTFSHSFLFVDTKLLALYSSRNSDQLPKRCVLLLIVIMKTLFSENCKAKKDSSSFQTLIIHDHYGKFYSAEENKSILVFLPLHKNEVVPFIVHFLKISSKITLVLLYELVKMTSLTKNLIFLINNFDNILNTSSNQTSVSSFEILDHTFWNLFRSLQKLKLPENNNYLKLAIVKWQQLKNFGFIDYLENPKKKLLESNLESVISSTCEIFKSIFNEFIIQKSLALESTSFFDTPFLEIKRLCSKRLKDCASYLEVKAEQNITMSSYITEYPGLIHFIYVDRNSDCMIAPSVILAEGHLKGTTSLKKKIWKMVKFGRKYVCGTNSFLCTWQHDDLKYFYSIWFENSDGKNIKPVKCVHPKYISEMEILCGYFFRDLMEICFPNACYDHIYCYEMFCVHLINVSTSEIIEQSKKLAARLWEFSGAHRVLDLL